MKEETKCNQDLIEHPIMEMIADKDFDGYLLTRFDVCVVKSLPGDIQTAALIYQDGRFFIRVAEKFMEDLTGPQRVAVLKHEIAHFINKHQSRRNGRDPRIWNIAGDMTINQAIRGIESIDGVVTLPNGWSANEPAEVYYDKLLQQASKQGRSKKQGKSQEQGQGQGKSQEQGQGQGKSQEQNGSGIPDQFDNVMDAPINEGADAESIADDIIRETIKERINAGESAERMRGLHAGALSEFVDELTKPPMINWRQALSRFAASLADAQTRRTLKRPDRREIAPWGKKREYLPSLVVCVDTSGSVSDEMLSQFFSQIALLQSMLSEVEVVIADAEVHEHFTYKYGMEDKLRNSGYGRGGTDFDPAVRYINKNLTHCDGAVYLTDGWCPVPEHKCRIPMIWVVTENEGFEGHPKIQAPDSNPRRRRRY